MICPVCNSKCTLTIVQPFNRFARLANILSKDIVYFKCPCCGVLFADLMMHWTPLQLSTHCYNSTYYIYDRDIITPNGSRQNLSADFIRSTVNIKTHLDYGGGNGYLSDILKNYNIDSKCYDPFTKYNDKQLLKDKYDLVSCILVLLHSYNIKLVISDLVACAKDKIYVSTGLCDFITDYNNWYYFNPRVGHMIIFTRNAILRLFKQHGFEIQLITQQHKLQMNILLERV